MGSSNSTQGSWPGPSVFKAAGPDSSFLLTTGRTTFAAYSSRHCQTRPASSSQAPSRPAAQTLQSTATGISKAPPGSQPAAGLFLGGLWQDRLDFREASLVLDGQVERPRTNPDANVLVGLADLHGCILRQLRPTKGRDRGDEEIFRPWEREASLHEHLAAVRGDDLPLAAAELQASQSNPSRFAPCGRCRGVKRGEEVPSYGGKLFRRVCERKQPAWLDAVVVADLGKAAIVPARLDVLFRVFQGDDGLVFALEVVQRFAWQNHLISRAWAGQVILDMNLRDHAAEAESILVGNQEKVGLGASGSAMRSAFTQDRLELTGQRASDFDHEFPPFFWNRGANNDGDGEMCCLKRECAGRFGGKATAPTVLPLAPGARRAKDCLFSGPAPLGDDVSPALELTTGQILGLGGLHRCREAATGPGAHREVGGVLSGGCVGVWTGGTRGMAVTATTSEAGS